MAASQTARTFIGEKMDKYINMYAKFIMRLENVPNYWYPVRFVLHWLTIPIKLLLIGGLGIYQIIYQTIFFSNRDIPAQTLEKKQFFLRSLFAKLPVVRSITEELYVSRVPYYEKPNGLNQNIDHQTAWHGVYTFIMSRIGKRNGFQDIAMSKHMKNGNLFRGYTFDDRVNANTVSGDMLVGASLAMLDVKGSVMEGLISQGGSGDVLRDKFDELVINIIENDYALLEGTCPEDGPERELYLEELSRHKNTADMVKIKSARGMWQPGLETVGAQAITILAAVRAADKKCGSLVPKRAYKRLLYRYGYGWLSLFPTAFTQSKRGYFNDNKCITGLYVLAKLADSALGRFFWTIPMVYVFLLSYRWRNGYFTGMLLDVAPYLKPLLKYHTQQCINYLYEANPLPYSRDRGFEVKQVKDLPVKFNDINQGEFSYDHEQKYMTNKIGEDNIIQTDNCHSGLGPFAAMAMLEPNFVRETLK